MPNNLRQFRKRNGMTTSQVAKLIGSSQPSISQYESGAREPSPKVYRKLADLYGVSVDELMGGEKELPGQPEQPADELLIKFSQLPQDIQKQALAFAAGLLTSQGNR